MATHRATSVAETALTSMGIEAFGLDLASLRPGLSSLLVSLRLVRDPSVPGLPRIRCAADVKRAFLSLADLDRETFVVLLLDGKHRVTGIHVVSIGTLQGTVVHPREVFKAAIVGNSAAIIAVHNHPSGDQYPSREDHEVTQRLKAVGETVGIPLLDHIIIAADGYYSFAESGQLQPFEPNPVMPCVDSATDRTIPRS